MGPIARADSRAIVVGRMTALMDHAARHGCDLVVYPELTLTTFFPRWFMEDQVEVDAFFETGMPNEATAPLFRRVRELGIAISLGYAEKAVVDGCIRRFNTAILIDRSGEIVHRYHRVHLPGHMENERWRPFQHLEKRYFEPGDTLFTPADCLGGKAGNEENCLLIGQSCIIAPTGEIVAMASTLGDELVTHDCDLDRYTEIRENISTSPGISGRRCIRSCRQRSDWPWPT